MTPSDDVRFIDLIRPSFLLRLIGFLAAMWAFAWLLSPTFQDDPWGSTIAYFLPFLALLGVGFAAIGLRDLGRWLRRQHQRLVR